MLVSLVVPCFRSAATLPDLVDRLVAVLPDACDGYEVILVVDGSPDDTWEIARGLAATYPAVRAIQLARNYGQHNALIAGIRSARYEVVVTMDDDLQHPPEEVPVLLRALTEDLDLVYGVPKEEEHGVVRSLASRLVKAGLAGPLGVRDARMISAFRVMRSFLRDAFDRVHGPDVSVDVSLSWATTRVGATTVRMNDRADGRSGYTVRALMRHSLNMILGYSTLPLRLVTYVGLTTAVVGVALFGWVLFQYFNHDTTVAGYTTTTAAIALFAAAQMIGLGVVGEYVGRIHTGGMGRPTYVVRQQVTGESVTSPAGVSVTPMAELSVTTAGESVTTAGESVASPAGASMTS